MASEEPRFKLRELLDWADEATVSDVDLEILRDDTRAFLKDG